MRNSVPRSFVAAVKALHPALVLATCLLVAASAHATAVLQGNTFFTSTQSQVMDGTLNWAVFDDPTDISALTGDYATLGGGSLDTNASYFYLYQFTNSGPSQLGSGYVTVNMEDLGVVTSVGWFSGWGFTDDGVPVSAAPDPTHPENLGDDTFVPSGVGRPGGSVGFTYGGGSVLDPANLWIGVNPWPNGVSWIQQWTPESGSCPGCIPDSPILVLTSNQAPKQYEIGELRNQSGWKSYGEVVVPVPEPSPALLTTLGLTGLALVRRSRRAR